ncbi:MAG TPA: CBS domain-containing protein [Acidisarcina sp.]|nr:CBS domain-containing protein [Acidisarcina sp.]
MEFSDAIGPIMKQKGQVWSVPPSSSVYDAVVAMAEKGVGALLVMEGDKLVGILSERDYARKVVIRGRSSKDTEVHEIMSSPVIFVTPKHTVVDCMRIITENRIRHLPVLEGERVIGVVSIGDLVNWMLQAQQETIRHLEAYITGRSS